MSGRDNKQMDARPDELIEHGQVTVRRYREDDLDAVLQAVTDSADHLRPWLPWAANYSREAAEGFLAGSIQGWDDGTVYNYAIRPRASWRAASA
jgi:hypothetical protein